jgi:large subunit ribosomal protein L5
LTNEQAVEQQASPGKAGSVMRSLRVAKVNVNIGVGQAGERLDKAKEVLKTLTGATPVQTVSKTTVRDWAIRDGMPIGCKVTLRGEAAEAFVKRCLWPRENRVPAWSFDQEGNLHFGVPDHTGLEGQKYNPDIGVFGMDVSITVERPGYRIKRRRLLRRHVPKRHRVGREESIAFLREKFNLEIV